ncbi:MAG: response regulator [Acidobacteria bacterium]|nr:response regulator [Acidobacteriota bacterium]
MSSVERDPLTQKVSELAQTIATTAEVSEILAAGARALQGLLGADRVTLWSLPARSRSLRWCGGTTGEWAGTELALSLYPNLAQLFAAQQPQWVELSTELWPSTPSPLLGAHSFLYLPLRLLGEPQGCAWAIFDRRGTTPPEKEVRMAQVVAALLSAGRRHAESRQRSSQREEGWDRLLHLAQALLRTPADCRTLESLLKATREVIGGYALALYPLQGGAWRRGEAAGSMDLLPEELPGGDPESQPWEKAAASSATVVVSGGECADAWAAAVVEFCPACTIPEHELWFVPVPTIGQAPCVLLSVVPPAAMKSVGPLLEVGAAFLGLTLAASTLPAATVQAEIRWQHLFESLPIPAFQLDAAGRFVLVNRALLEWTGKAARELLGQPWAAFLDEAGRDAFAAWRTSGKSCWRHEIYWHGQTGPQACLLVLRKIGLPQEGYWGFLHDLTALQRVERERQQMEARLKGLLDATHDGVWLIGTDQRVQFANHRLANLLGVDLREIGPGKSQASLIEQLQGRFREPERMAERWHYLNNHMEEVSWDEVELIHPRHRMLERFVRPLTDSAQRPVGRLEVYHDVTARRQLEQKVVQRERLAALGQLISGVAHELNNPLTAVAGYAQLLQQHKLSEGVRRELTRLAQEAGRASRIVKNLLLFARPRKPERQRVDIQPLLEQCLQFRAYELAVQNIAIEQQFASDLPAVWADPHQLQQVFLNILLNAEQAIRSIRDRGRIILRTHSLKDPARVRAEITDDGPGISPEDLAHVFEPFFTTKEAYEGTGLGLSVSQTIVKDHQGEIYAESHGGGGTTFAVELPTLPGPRPVTPGRQRAALQPVAERRQPQVLVVDDEESVAQLIGDVLRQQGCQVQLRTNSQQALQDALSQEFDLLICDIKMPAVDGETFHRRLAEHSHPLAARILFTTGDTLARQTSEFLERVQLPCLAKPFLVEELKAAVRELLLERAAGETPERQ